MFTLFCIFRYLQILGPKGRGLGWLSAQDFSGLAAAWAAIPSGNLLLPEVNLHRDSRNESPSFQGGVWSGCQHGIFRDWPPLGLQSRPETYFCRKKICTGSPVMKAPPFKEGLGWLSARDFSGFSAVLAAIPSGNLLLPEVNQHRESRNEIPSFQGGVWGGCQHGIFRGWPPLGLQFRPETYFCRK